MEQPVPRSQSLYLLHGERRPPPHGAVVRTHALYVKSVAVALGRELSRSANVAYPHAVVVQACRYHYLRVCRVSLLHVSVEQSQGTVGVAAYWVEPLHALLQRISAVVAPVPPPPFPVAAAIFLYMAAQEVIAVKIAVAVIHQRAPFAREHHIVFYEPVMAVVWVVEVEAERDKMWAARCQRVFNWGISKFLKTN